MSSLKRRAQAADETTFQVLLVRKNQPPTFTLPEDLTVTAGQPLRATITATDPDDPPVPLKFTLVQGPSGATLDADSGELVWTPSKDAPEGTVSLVVRVEEAVAQGLTARGRLRVTVVIPETPIDLVLAKLRDHGLNVRTEAAEFEHPFGGTPGALTIDGQQVRFFEYEDTDAARADAIKIAKDRAAMQMPRLPESWIGPTRYFLDGQVLLVYAGLDEELVANLTKLVAEPLAASQPSRSSMPGTEPADNDSADTPAPGELSAAELDQLETLHENGQLFRPRNYPVLRDLFAARFERDFAEIINGAIGADTEFRKWLDAHPDWKNEFYTAIDPQVDDVARCLQLMQELYEDFPDHLESHRNLAIAVAITWDQPDSVQTHRGPLRQAKAVAPDNPATAQQIFAHFLQSAPLMQGRAQWFPWEFLIHVVNHTTPIAQQQWALARYVNLRPMYGSCYKTVPYDTEMLDSGGKVGRIHGKIYTLENILKYGGVCAHQADFAARVGKCLGVPAAYVSGQSTYGESHAWVMWVEVKTVTAQSIVFSLESFGRYRGDKYYVGRLREPQSGKSMTDRQLELRLHMAGMDPLAKRQADWVMRVFEPLKDKKSLTVVQQFLYLRSTLELCAGNEQAWSAVAKMASQEDVRAKHKKDMAKILDSLFVTFANFPDFTWTIFDDLIAYHESADKRIELYGRLVALYELQGAPTWPAKPDWCWPICW